MQKNKSFVWLEVYTAERQKLSEEMELILFDIGGQLHDTHSAPEVALNFESTPQQLLERVQALP